MNLPADAEKAVFQLRRDFYESTLSVSDVSFSKGVLRLKLRRLMRSGGYRPYLLTVRFVESVTWTLPNSCMTSLFRERHSLLVTNIWLNRRYVESRRYELLFEGYPEWEFTVRIRRDRPLALAIGSRTGRITPIAVDGDRP